MYTFRWKAVCNCSCKANVQYLPQKCQKWWRSIKKDRYWNNTQSTSTTVNVRSYIPPLSFNCSSCWLIKFCSQLYPSSESASFPSASISLYSRSNRKAETFISHVYLNFNSNTRQSEHLRSICTRVSGGCRKVLRFYMISVKSQEFCRYHKLHGNESHHQQLVAGGGEGVGGGFGLHVKWDWSRVQNQ